MTILARIRPQDADVRRCNQPHHLAVIRRACARNLTVPWPDLFAAMLNCWLTDEQQWPTNRTRKMFAAWFDIQMCSVVEDLHLDKALVDLE